MKHILSVALVAILSTNVTAQMTWTQVISAASCTAEQELAFGANSFSDAIEDHWVVSGPGTSLSCNSSCPSAPGASVRSISGFGNTPDPNVYLEYGVSTPFLTNFQVEMNGGNSAFEGRTSIGGPDKVLIEVYMVKDGAENLAYAMAHSISDPNCFSISPQGGTIEVESEDSLVVRFYPYFYAVPVDPNAWFGVSHFGVGGIVSLGVLPVGLLQFQAYAMAESVGHGNALGMIRIEWSTATETNNSHFVIDHSVDGEYWVPVGTVEGQGNSLQTVNYVHIVSGEAGTNYYRLRQFDYDGTETIFNSVSVSLSEKSVMTTLVRVGESIPLPSGSVVRGIRGEYLGMASNGTFVFANPGIYLVGGTKLVVQ